MTEPTRPSLLALLGALLLGMPAITAARAGEVCDTVESCRALQARVKSRLATLLDGIAPRLIGLARNPDGRARRMDHHGADRYCRDKGQRLPTARELARYAQGLGAQGISATPNADFRPVRGSDPAGNSDPFHFSLKGYRPPPGDLGEVFLWSSSVDPVHSDYAYILFGADGEIEPLERDRDGYYFANGAVRCVRSR